MAGDRSPVLSDIATTCLPDLPEYPPIPAPAAHLVFRHPRVQPFPVYWSTGLPHAPRWVLLRPAVAEKVVLAALSLPAGFGLAVLDAWRPLEVQEELYARAYKDPTLPAGFVSFPSSDPNEPPPHLTGAALDVTLTFEGRMLALGTDFDAFEPASRPDFFETSPGPTRSLRRMLYHAMHSQWFVQDAMEWWHFEYGTRRWSAHTDEPTLYGATSTGS